MRGNEQRDIMKHQWTAREKKTDSREGDGDEWKTNNLLSSGDKKKEKEQALYIHDPPPESA